MKQVDATRLALPGAGGRGPYQSLSATSSTSLTLGPTLGEVIVQAQRAVSRGVVELRASS
jgi:hypothetical protein